MHMNTSKTDLKFNVAQLLREEIGGRRHYTFREDELPLDEALTLQQIEGDVRFTRTASGVLADVRARGTVDLLCARCLAPAPQQITLHFRDEFHSVIEVTTGVSLPEPDEEDPFLIDESHLVDIGEALREYALIQIPMQALCHPECKGLCPNCGIDRNVETCDCQNDTSDERFAALRVLLDKD